DIEVLQLAAPEAIVDFRDLVVRTIGLTIGRQAAGSTVSTGRPTRNAGGTTSTGSAGLCTFVAVLGLAVAIGAVLMLPRNATLFGGMLVISPLTSLFKIICVALAFFTVLLTTSEKA